MARARTRAAVLDAAMALAREHPNGITMEGIAARAGVSKQTVYRTWPSASAVLFDALLARSEDAGGDVALPCSPDLASDLAVAVAGMVAELHDPDVEPLLRQVTAQIQIDEQLAAQLQARLLDPQLAAIAARFRAAGVLDADDAAELLVAPILHRWLLRTRPFDDRWLDSHVARTLAAVGR